MLADALPEADDTCVPIARCALEVCAEPWSFAAAHAAEIEAHWQRAQAERDKLFNGAIFVLGAGALQGTTFTGTFLRTQFKSFLYWRETGYPDASVRDGFGSAVILSSEGYALFGRQTAGNVNAGLAYPPGGFIDARDVRGTSIDIDASIARELAEETGLSSDDLSRSAGYLLTQAGPFVSIGIVWRSALPAVALRERILAHVHRQPVPELADVVIVRRRDDIDEAGMPRYARAIVRRLFPA